MRKLEAVEEARAIMTKGLEWGVFKWLMEKPKVRKIADRATETLNDREDKVRATWSNELKRAYNHLATQAASKGKTASRDGGRFDPGVLETARKVFNADEETETMRLGAEDSFAEGERKLSAVMAREGAQKALANLRPSRKSHSKGGGRSPRQTVIGKDVSKKVPAKSYAVKWIERSLYYQCRQISPKSLIQK